MDNLLLSWTLVSSIALIGAVLLGRFLQRGCGISLLALATLASVGLCYLGAWLYGWIGMSVSVLLVGMGGALVGFKIGGGRGARTVALLWLGFSSSALVGYWIGNAIGAVVVSLVTTILFWATLYRFSAYVLPLEQPFSAASERTTAFRSLVTYSMGTNFPYYVMNGRELEQRVGGKPFRAFFGGPGIVLTGCDHIVVLTNGGNLRVAQAPGLVFTQRLEVVDCVVDLRPQLRSFFVEAHTQDGIAVRVETFVPCRVNWGGRRPVLGEPFPFSSKAIFRVVRSEPVEQGQDHRHSWDDLVEIHATRILRDLICRYNFDKLCLATGAMIPGRPDDDDLVARHIADEQPFEGPAQDDPRVQIRDALLLRLTNAMREFDIEVLGAGIGNLRPIDRAVTRQRIDNWRTKWQNRMTLVEADREARRTRLREQARNAVERDLLVVASEMLAASLASGQDMSEELLAAAFVASLEKMAENPNVKELLSREALPKLAFLRAQGRAVLPPEPMKDGGQ